MGTRASYQVCLLDDDGACVANKIFLYPEAAHSWARSRPNTVYSIFQLIPGDNPTLIGKWRLTLAFMQGPENRLGVAWRLLKAERE